MKQLTADNIADIACGSPPPLLDIQQNGMGDVVLACWLAESAAAIGRPVLINPRRWTGLPRLLGIPASAVTTWAGRSATRSPDLGLRHEYRAVQKALETGQQPDSRFALWAEAIALAAPDGGPLSPVRPRYCEDLADRRWGRAQWAKLPGGDAPPRVLVFPDSARRVRRWPQKSFAELVRRFRADGWSVAAMGSKRDALAGIGCRFWYGHGIERVAAMIAQADLVVTNDTGPAHLSGTIGTSTLALCGPTDGSVVFAHLPEVTPVSAAGALAPACAPCHFSKMRGYGDSCRDRGCLALTGLTVEAVRQAGRDRLARALHDNMRSAERTTA